MKITLQQLLAIMPNARYKASTFLPHINNALTEFDISTPLRIAYFLATIAVESGELRYTKELASGKAYDTGRRAMMLGNTPVADGDGMKYKGRGLIQLTGRKNYEAYKKYCGFDVVQTPQLLEKPLGATRSAGWFWQTHGLNRWADEDSPTMVRKRVNGGLNGYKEFLRYLAIAKKAMEV